MSAAHTDLAQAARHIRETVAASGDMPELSKRDNAQLIAQMLTAASVSWSSLAEHNQKAGLESTPIPATDGMLAALELARALMGGAR